MFVKRREFGVYQGYYFSLKLDKNINSVQNSDPTKVKNVSILLSTFLCLFFQILLRAHAQEKQDGIPFLAFSCLALVQGQCHLIYTQI